MTTEKTAHPKTATRDLAEKDLERVHGGTQVPDSSRKHVPTVEMEPLTAASTRGAYQHNQTDLEF